MRSFFAILLFVFVTTACDQAREKLQEEVKKTEGSLEIAKVYPTSVGPEWTSVTRVNDDDILSPWHLIPGLDLTIFGTCSGKTTTIKVYRSSSLLEETATCGTDGTFSWRQLFQTYQAGSNVFYIRAFNDEGRQLLMRKLNVKLDAEIPTPTPEPTPTP